MRNTSPNCLVALLLLVAAACHGGRSWAAEADKLKAQLRRPVALSLSTDGQWLYVANRRSGSVSVIDTLALKTASETQIGRRLSDMIVLDQSRLLATDQQAHQLLVLLAKGTRLEVIRRIPVSPYPVSVVVTDDRRRAIVASLWSRRLTLVELGDPLGTERVTTRFMDLPFAPRKLLLVRGGAKLIVADAFGGRLGIVDLDRAKLAAVREFYAHNIRGLALSADGDKLLVSHQMLNEYAHTVRNDVHWGMLMSNDLRWLVLDAVLDPGRDFYEDTHMHPLGEPNNGSADPGSVVISADSSLVVTLSGTDQIALGKEADYGLFRLKVGRRPTAVAVSIKQGRAYIANMLGDSVSVVDLQRREEVTRISLGPGGPLSLADRGELLFYDGRLSHDGWLSCHSCHTDGHTNGQLNDNFSDGSFGAPKRVLSLLGLADTGPYAWNAGARNLEDQIRKSIRNTMQGPEATRKQTAALAAFLRGLRPPPPLDVLRGKNDKAAIARGRELFHANKCGRCHARPTYTTPKTYNVGLKDKQGAMRFNPPSLRGVSQRGPYFHDDQPRAKTLEDVFRKNQHRLDSPLSEQQLSDLLAFLRSL